jgi:hypothetical protein
MKQLRFDTPGEVEVHVENKAGTVRLCTGMGTVTEVDVSGTGPAAEEFVEHTRVEHRELEGRHHVVVEVPSRGGLLRSLLGSGTDVLVSVRLPEGSAIDVVTTSGAVSAEGRFGPAGIETVSGTVSVSSVDGDLKARSTSGSVALGSVSGETKVVTVSGSVRCDSLGAAGRVRTTSGDITVEVAQGPLSIKTTSGDVTAGELAGGCQFQTASGDQRVKRLVAGEARLETVSGNMTVGVARGTVVAVDAETVTGSLSSEIELASEDAGPAPEGPAGGWAEVRARSVSGDLHIERAPT